MNCKMTLVYINEPEKEHSIDLMSKEEYEEIGNKLNDKALRAIGYRPVEELEAVSEKRVWNDGDLEIS